jgi:hypothetical protein
MDTTAWIQNGGLLADMPDGRWIYYRGHRTDICAHLSAVPQRTVNATIMVLPAIRQVFIFTFLLKR